MAAISHSWAQLVSTTENLSDPIEIHKNKFTIGRSKAADICLSGNKLVSGQHCHIEKDDKGKVWLLDTSTNGTLLNLTIKVQGTRVLLNHGDEIYVVYRKNEPEVNVAYMYQDLEMLRREETDESSEQTQEYSHADLDLTSENTDPLEPDPGLGSNNTTKRKSENEEEYQDQKPAKKQKCDEVDQAEEIIAPIQGEPQPKAQTDQPDAFEESLICIICQEILHDCISCQPCMHAFCAGCYSDWMSRSNECPSCRSEVERVNKNYIVNNLVEAYLKEHPEKKRPAEELSALDARSKIMRDSMKPPKPKRTLSEVIDDDDDDEVDDDDDDVIDLSDSDEDNITHNVVTFTAQHNLYRPPRTVCRQCPDYKDPEAPGPAPGTTAIITMATAVTNTISRIAEIITGGTTSTSIDNGGGDGCSLAPPVAGCGRVTSPYTCTANQIHILCQCCLKPMPDRRTVANFDLSIPKQQCTLCYRMYCHCYWGCKIQECSGCLFRFRDMKLPDRILPTLILNNASESNIFLDYLRDAELELADVIRRCMENLDNGSYHCQDQLRGLTSQTVVCFSCGLSNLRGLLFQYRRNIDNSELPDEVTRRPNCHWGYNCRTQRNKPHHAAKFNHICEQTNFG